MSARPLTIRKAGSSHVDLLLYLQLEYLPGDEPLPIHSGHLAWIAWAGPDPVGFVLFADGGTDILVLERAGVSPGYQGQGIYRRLLRAAERGMRRPSRLVTYTANRNLSSANGLIAAGWRLYEPAWRWGWADGLYFTRVLT